MSETSLNRLLDFGKSFSRLEKEPYIEHWKFYMAARDACLSGERLNLTDVQKASFLAVHRTICTVYFIAAPESRLIKIGKTTDMQRRFASLKTSSPVELRLLDSIEYDYWLEDRIHRHLAEDRKHGEWFAASDRVLDFIEGCQGRGAEFWVGEVGDAGEGWRTAPIQNRQRNRLHDKILMG